MSLAIGCDLTIASDDAYFATAYKAIGVTPDGGQSYFLPRLVGMKKSDGTDAAFRAHQGR